MKERNKQRQDKLARQNPDRIQRQIDTLKAGQERSGGALPKHDARHLEQLEKDLVSIIKAKEAIGETWKPRKFDDTRERGEFRQNDGKNDRKRRYRDDDEALDSGININPMLVS